MGEPSAETAVDWQGHRGALLTHAKGYDILDCRACGFRHAVPLPEPTTLEKAYRDEYYADEKPTFLAHAGEDQAWAELAQTDRLEIFERVLEQPRRQLLDIGSGPGFFLKTAQARGWDVTGIEPSRQAAAHARGLGMRVVEGFFNADSAPTLGRFDVVHMNNVLEHIPDPVALVSLARDLVKPSGVVCINVPNDFSPFQLAASASQSARQWWLAPPHHLNYFDFTSLCGLVERLGMRVIERTTSFPMEAFVMMGDNYIDDPALGRACHTRRKKFDLALETAGLRSVRRAFYRALAEQGIGREAVVIARVP
ncbi:MAG TPA: class I SAM-dependent methyltransferase [Rhizomicrobium sp.]|nr:class I SAM-dependent methyltransferase [Rhizomicrobium sp.]